MRELWCFFLVLLKTFILKYRSLSIFPVFFFLVLAFTSCTQESGEKSDLKVLTFVIKDKVKGFDPIYSQDQASIDEIFKIYDALYEHHYLKRPIEVIPNLAEAMPAISKDGLTYTIKIKKGITFHDGPCFSQGKGRELVAEDFIYSVKRLADTKLMATGYWTLQNKIVGLDEWREENAKRERTDYGEAIEGLKALDTYTIQIKLKKPFPQLLHILSMSYLVLVPYEAVEYYKEEFTNHPVGTGAFILPVYTRLNRIVYERNPKFREKFYPTEGAEEFIQKGFLKDAGKRIPFVDRIILEIVSEDNPNWLNFLKGRYDWIVLPKDNFATTFKARSLSLKESEKEISQKSTTKEALDLDASLKEKGISLGYSEMTQILYDSFNFGMPLFQNKKLRQAISLALDRNSFNMLFYNDTGRIAQSVIPLGFKGYIQDANLIQESNIEKAKKLLKEAGYPLGVGLPTITYDGRSDTASRQQGEFFVQELSKIGIKAEFIANPWPELLNKMTTKSHMILANAWSPDYPDAETFLQLFYSENAPPGANIGAYKNTRFDELYRKISTMMDSENRTKIYEEMNKILMDDTAAIFKLYPFKVFLQHSWLENYISDAGIIRNGFMYQNINLEKKREMLKKL